MKARINQIKATFKKKKDSVESELIKQNLRALVGLRQVQIYDNYVIKLLRFTRSFKNSVHSTKENSGTYEGSRM